MRIESWVRERGGIVSRAEVAAAGFGRHVIERADLARIGRFHLATPDAPMPLRRAVAHRGVLACASAADFRGLALLNTPDVLHLWVPLHSNARPVAEVRHHRTRRHLPALGLVESVPDMLEHVARCLPEREALVVWESAVQRHLVTLAELRRIAWRTTSGRRIAAVTSTGSESILESLLAHALREAGVDFRQQVRLLGHAVDVLVGSHLVIQADGYEHHQGADRERDLRHDARLVLAGFTVLRFSYDDIVRRMPYVIETIRRAMAQGLHKGSTNA